MPPEPGKTAEVPLFVSVFGQTISLYRDMAGDSLHRRGYRSAMHRASLNEAAAAGLLLLSGWQGQQEESELSLLRIEQFEWIAMQDMYHA